MVSHPYIITSAMPVPTMLISLSRNTTESLLYIFACERDSYYLPVCDISLFLFRIGEMFHTQPLPATKTKNAHLVT